jgi:hypothetical protein
MQIYIFVPILAIIIWKHQFIGTLVCLGLIVSGVFINIHLTNKYDLTIGLIDTNNYFLLQAIISKPWTKTGNVGLAGISALIYHRLLKYRKTKDSKKYWAINKFV